MRAALRHAPAMCRPIASYRKGGYDCCMKTQPTRTQRLIVAAAMALAVMQFGPWFMKQFTGERISAEAMEARLEQIKPLDGEALTQLLAPAETPSLLFVYASWCPYCRKQAPIMEQLARDFEGKLNIVPISIDEDSQKLAVYLQRSGFALETFRVDEPDYLRFRKALATSGSQFTGGIPHSVLLGKDGKLIDEVSGHVEYEVFKSALEKAL